MPLSEKEKMQILEVVYYALDKKLDEMTKEIIAGFVECIDWHNENFAKIMKERGDRQIEFYEKQKREVIEIRTREREEEKQDKELQKQKDAEVSSRLGFTAKAK